MPTKLTKKERALLCAARLKEHYPDAVCSLEYDNDPWKLLVLSRLSAQCTDARVNIVARPLFAAYPDCKAMAAADRTVLESIIFPCGLYRTKARDLIRMCGQLETNYGGRVPDTMEELLSLAGVGRKIANLILGDVFGKGGIVADTHCIRISERLGLTSGKNPVTTERTLSALLPTEIQTDFCHRLVHFGRDICSAKAPKCAECFLKDICPQAANEKAES